MWEVEKHFQHGMGYWYTISNGIDRHCGLAGTYRTPYRIEAQQIADELNGVENASNQ